MNSLSTTIVYHISSPKALLARPRATSLAGSRRSGVARRLPIQAMTAEPARTPMNAQATHRSEGRITWISTAATQMPATRAAQSIRRAERAEAAEGGGIMEGSLGWFPRVPILSGGDRKRCGFQVLLPGCSPRVPSS